MSNAGVARFTVGGVLSRGFDVLRRNFASFGTLAAMFTLPPFIAAVLVGVGSASYPAAGQTGAPAATVSAVVIALIVLWVLCYFVVFAALTHGTICDLRGSPARLGQSLGWALRRLLPVVGITFVASFCAVLGVIAFVVPGLFLITVWWVAVPATVVEQTGVFASLGRSFELTRGHRWQVFGLILIVYVGQAVIERVILPLFSGAPIFSIFANLVTMVLFTAYVAVVTAVCYHDLRIVKEGVGVDDIAKVFD